MHDSILVLGLILLIWTSAAFAEAVRPSQIVGDATTYDGKHLTVSGTVQHVTAKTSRRGNEYETFDLCNNSCVEGLRVGTSRVARRLALIRLRNVRCRQTRRAIHLLQ